ncbi:MAG: HD domain-containing protein [Spirochaetales bacterium]|nr:HD domain-containing protein [Spirochaetales bacterium]
MSFQIFEDIFSLLCTIIGLLFCIFKYIEAPRHRVYSCLLVFFLANFLSEYYWTIYELVMRIHPDVSMFVAYLGWNIGYVVLFLAVLSIRRDDAKRFFHPVMLLPVALNIPQFILYIQYGGILNNVWEVGFTTVTMVFCLQDIVFYVKNRGSQKTLPWLSILVLAYLVSMYGMWTASCFDWSTEITSPYLYFCILSSLLCLFFARGAGMRYETDKPDKESKTASELRFQILIQAIVSIVIIGICAVGFFTAYGIKKSMTDGTGLFRNEDHIVAYLFAISVILILLVLVMLFVLTTRYRRIMKFIRKMNEGNRSRLHFVFTVIVTLALMLFALIYNSMVLYRSSVVNVFEDGDEAIKSTATELESYLTVASTTLRVAADSVDLLVENGSSVEEIERFIIDQTTRQAEKFDENFTGIYALINGVYLDGLSWVPPEGYEPTSRDWYTTAVAADGEVVIVSPYLDAQTGSVVISFARSISDSEPHDVVCLDVIVNHISELAQDVKIAGKGYGMVVNSDGFIIAHRDESMNGQIVDSYLLDSIMNAEDGRAKAKINGENCSLFVCPVMNQWYLVIVITNDELMEDTYSKMAVNVMVSVITFCLIAFFYYIGYKNEQIYGRKVEEMNIQVVKALATSIDAKDKYTNGHSTRVAEYSRMIAARSGFSKPEQDEIYMMALLHDVGKIGVPDTVIKKTEKLSNEEYELIKRHPIIGDSILGSIKERPDLAIGARWHHERYDGKGYPDGKSGEDIPEEARIIAIADAYDAMTSRRSYRDVLRQDDVVAEIENGMGTQFDPKYAKVMLSIIDEDVTYTLREK